MPKKKPQTRYEALIAEIFQRGYKQGVVEIPFDRSQLISVAEELGIPRPDNLGDVIYSFKFRQPLPASIVETAPKGMEWIIDAAGRAKYKFKLVKVNRILPSENLITIKIPDNTPEIIGAYALGDEQALLAKVRYNRLIDIFLGLSAYSLQNHLRTTVKGIGQIEIDEIYVGIDTHGQQFIIPVQAKGGTDQLSVVQTRQDMLCCVEKFPLLKCLPISVQFLDGKRIAMFLLAMEKDEIKVVVERHYLLVPADKIKGEDLEQYRVLAR